MTPTKTRPHKPMLAEWTSGTLSLSLSLSLSLGRLQNGCEAMAESHVVFVPHGQMHRTLSILTLGY